MAPPPRKLHVQKTDNDVVLWTERKVKNELKSGDLSGLEMVRYEDDTEWQPLHNLDLYRETVPVVGDPRDVARRRLADGLKGHLMSYGIGTVAMVAIFGGFPWWMAIWGFFVALHAFRAGPTALGLLKEGKLFGQLPTATAPLPTSTGSADARKVSVADECQRLRDLLKDDGARGVAELREELDQLESVLLDVERREQQLERSATDDDRRRIERRLGVLRSQQLDGRPEAEAELESLEAQLAGLDEANRLRGSLLAQRSVALNKLSELRIDLSRTLATGASASSFTSRLADIRFTIEAESEAEALVAGATSGADVTADQAHVVEEPVSA